MGSRAKLLLPLHVLIVYFVSFETYVSIKMDTNAMYPGQSLSGVWYSLSVDIVVWVANRDEPLLDPFGWKLELTEKGSLVLYNQSAIPVWSSSNTVYDFIVAVLEDCGNLVLRNGSSSSSSVIVWESFDHPTDTWLPGAKLGGSKMNRKGQSQSYVSWSSSNDPSPGPFSLVLDGAEEYHVLKNGHRHWTCNWLERVSSFSTETVDDKYTTMEYVSNKEENLLGHQPLDSCKI
ncbi:G-type lectin S-receptor-like serine/threonine-protein kinase At2g19130 [Hibiscus syriacus]|uniref:G-type lectin S-receptor-like serine/threonine-protein kinase At2g19130 n=1 Tax=Hibiscus syriacus TaxID=106335 RepID=UPI001920C4AD|nr:G-type lectin S-receptor-like serine/threonine-protein kinase At2g19130 [Hibiscus syriacus]